MDHLAAESHHRRANYVILEYISMMCFRRVHLVLSFASPTGRAFRADELRWAVLLSTRCILIIVFRLSALLLPLSVVLPTRTELGATWWVVSSRSRGQV